MKRLITLLLIVSPVFAVIGCTSSTSVMQPKEIMPLAIGNRWIWQVTDRDSSGQIISIRLDTLSITGATTHTTYIGHGQFDSIRWYSTAGDTYPPFWQRITTVSLYSNRSDGLYDLIDPVDWPGSGHRLIKYPASVGDSVFVIPGMIPDTIDSKIVAEDSCFVSSTSAILSVPAGTYSCYQYTDEDISMTDSVLRTRNSFYAPGVGLVQFEWTTYQYFPRYTGIPIHEVWQLVRVDLH